MAEVFGTAAAIIASVGVGGGVVAALSSWLGKVWANRLMMQERAAHERRMEELRSELREKQEVQLRRLESELGVAQRKILDIHEQKLNAYRAAVDIVADLSGELTFLIPNGDPRRRIQEIRQDFDRKRLRLWGYLAMIAPQDVMDAHDAMMDQMLAVLNGEEVVTWERVRNLAIEMINAIRRDVGVDPQPITYRGIR